MKERFETFTVRIASISRNVRRIKTDAMAEFDLRSHHVSVLYYIYREDALTAKELCDLCEEDKANISRSIKYLEEHGFLYCESSARKRYLAPLMLTEKGKTAGKRLAEKIDEVLHAVSEGVSEEDRIIFYRSLKQISDNLQRICDKDK